MLDGDEVEGDVGVASGGSSTPGRVDRVRSITIKVTMMTIAAINPMKMLLRGIPLL